jgi:hypothetical protein
MDEQDAEFWEQVHTVEIISAQLRSGEGPGRAPVEGVLERGFGRLMVMEAELQRARAGGSLSEADRMAVARLQHLIAALRDALTELRTLSSPPGPPRIGYGFVLPQCNESPARIGQESAVRPGATETTGATCGSRSATN